MDSSNLYAFAGGDPVNRTDPTGTDSVTLKGIYVWSDERGIHKTDYRNTFVGDVRALYERLAADNVPIHLRDLIVERITGTSRGTELVGQLAPAVVAGVKARAQLQLAVTAAIGVSVATAGAASAAGAGVFVSGAAGGLAYQATEDVLINQEASSFEAYALSAVTGGVLGKVAAALDAGTLIRFRAPLGSGQPLRAYNVSTVGRSPEETAAIREYARRTNEWLRSAGPQTIRATKGELQRQAAAAARAERLRAARAGEPYGDRQAGHVPDTAISGQAEPPGGWQPMPGASNQCCGGGLSSRIGETIDVITVDGALP